jgi:hypothetical protein
MNNYMVVTVQTSKDPQKISRNLVAVYQKILFKWINRKVQTAVSEGFGENTETAARRTVFLPSTSLFYWKATCSEKAITKSNSKRNDEGVPDEW